MSYEDGMAALTLQMPHKIPRTEYSAASHWKLIKAVTGINVTHESPEELQQKASTAFVGPEGWDYAFMWETPLHRSFLDACRTDMGHAEYADGGVDKRETITCPFSTPEEVLNFHPEEVYGPLDTKAVFKRLDDHLENVQKIYPDTVNMIGIYITLMSGLIEIFGWDMLLLAAGTDPEKFGEVANRYAEWNKTFFECLAEHPHSVVMVHDDIVWSQGAFIHPDWYRKYIFPNYKKQFAPLLDAKKIIMYTSDANYTDFIDDIADCGVGGFVMEPMTDMKYIAEKYGQTHFFVGNADVRIIQSGTEEDIKNEVKRCIDIGKDCPGFIMAVGNHIPSNVPVENALLYDAYFQEMRTR